MTLGSNSKCERGFTSHAGAQIGQSATFYLCTQWAECVCLAASVKCDLGVSLKAC